MSPTLLSSDQFITSSSKSDCPKTLNQGYYLLQMSQQPHLFSHRFKKLPTHLYPCVHFINVWDATKDGLNLFLSQDGASNLALLLQRIFEELKRCKTKRDRYASKF